MYIVCCKDRPCAITTLWSPPISYEQLYDLFYVRSFVLSAVTLWGLMRYVWNTGEHVVPACVMAYSVIAHLHVFIMTEALRDNEPLTIFGKENPVHGKEAKILCEYRWGKVKNNQNRHHIACIKRHKCVFSDSVISLHVRCKLQLYSYTGGYFTTVK